MKKIRKLSLLLVLVLLLQSLAIPVSASETTNPTDVTETAEPTETTEAVYYEIPTVEYGSASITNGCRTINGMTPMAGTERRLETAQSAFLFETTTETVIYSYNPDVHVYPGSLAKMMTALLAIENSEMDKVITCSTRWNDSLPLHAQVADIKEGEELTMRDLVACLLIDSANDAALIIANNVATNEAAFVEMMNQRAVEMGCTDTNFTNVHGLDDENQYTTARDMAKITVEACKNATFKEIFGTTEYTIAPTNRTEEEVKLQSGNHLMYEGIISKFYNKYVTGGMPSYTSTAGASVSCTINNDEMNLVLVIMGANRTFNDYGNADYYGNFDEATELLVYALGEFRITRVLYPDMALDQFPVLGGECSVVGQPDVAINTVLPKKCQLDNLNFRYTVEGGGLTAPIEKGEKIATVQVWYRTSCVTEAVVYAMNPVRSTINSGVTISNAASRDDSNVTGILKYIGTACMVVVVLFAIYLAINYARRVAAQRKRRRRRASRRRSR